MQGHFQGKGHPEKSDTTVYKRNRGRGLLACPLTLPRRSTEGLSSLQASSGSTITSCFPSSGPWLSRSGPKAAGLFLFKEWGVGGSK